MGSLGQRVLVVTVVLRGFVVWLALQVLKA